MRRAGPLRAWGLVTLVLALFALLGMAAQVAFAAKVANPGPFSMRFETGHLRIKDQTFDAASSDDPVTGSGTIASNGNITLTSLVFPVIQFDAGSPVGTVTVRILVQGNPTGNLNPLTGVMTLQARVAIKIEGNFIGDNCYVGTPQNPVVLNLTTETTNPPGPNTPISGTRYDSTTGFVTLVDNSFAVPGAQGCNTFPVNVNDEVNSQLHLPSAAGNNEAVLTASTNPIIQPAIRPSFTATPTNGPQPLDVNFDASSSSATKGINHYEWDFDGNGTTDLSTTATTASHLYSSQGTYTAKLTVFDNEGDSASKTQQIVVGPPEPDLAITKSHSGDFVTGTPGTYDISVENDGSAASGVTTVTDTLPAGLGYDSSSGAGWSCAASGQTVTCANSTPIAPGDSAATLHINVTVDQSTQALVTNVATVSTPSDSNPSNDSASDPTHVLQAGIDLQMFKSHDATDGFFRGHTATYVLAVKNVGTLATVGRVHVDDTLPAGVSYVGASGGPAWTCSQTSGTVHCFSDQTVNPGDSLPDIHVVVDVLSDAGDTVSNSATVTTSGDTNHADDTGTDIATPMGFAADYQLTMSHVGDFIVGQPGFYELDVKNVGTATGGDPLTILDQLPTGMSYVSESGDGWACQANGQLVTCEHDGQVEAGDALPSLTMKVATNATAAANSPVTNVAQVSSDDDHNGENDVASDPTIVRSPRPDLAIAKTHEGNFTVGQVGTWTISVSNTSAEPADGPTTVVDTLPAGLSYFSAAGPGWSCGHSGQTVTCTYAAQIPGLAAAPDLTVQAMPAQSAVGVPTNVATVQNAQDTKAGDNIARDPTVVQTKAQAPTNLNATPLVASVNTKTGSVHVLQGLSARLTVRSTGKPIPNKVVYFRDASGHRLCDAKTNYNGVANCNGDPALLLKAVLKLHYTAHFRGDPDYSAARDTQSILNVNGLRLP